MLLGPAVLLAQEASVNHHPYPKEKKSPCRVLCKGKSNATDRYYSLKFNAKCTHPSITSDIHFFSVEHETFLSVM